MGVPPPLPFFPLSCPGWWGVAVPVVWPGDEQGLSFGCLSVCTRERHFLETDWGKFQSCGRLGCGSGAAWRLCAFYRGGRGTPQGGRTRWSLSRPVGRKAPLWALLLSVKSSQEWVSGDQWLPAPRDFPCAPQATPSPARTEEENQARFS